VLGKSNFEVDHQVMLTAKEFLLVLTKNGRNNKISVWNIDSNSLIGEVDFQKTNVAILGLMEFQSSTILTIMVGGGIEQITILSYVGALRSSSEKITVVDHQKLTTPKELDLSIFERFDFSNNIRFMRFGKRIVFIERLQARTIFWIFNPETAKFEDLMSGTQSVSISNKRGYVWLPEGKTGFLNVWLQDDLDPTQLTGMQISSKDQVEFSNDNSRMLVMSEEGAGELWHTDFPGRKASWLARLEAPHNSWFSFSSDGKFIFARSRGGTHTVWDHDGKPTGTLGKLGSRVQASIYRQECRQILLWTDEGQRLDLRPGFNVPVYGFLPERDCPDGKLKSRRLIDPVLDLFAG
jgi:WD40 repeat protein